MRSGRGLTAALTLSVLLCAFPTRAWADDIHYVPVGSAPVKGPADALVTIVAFLDFQCPFCARTLPRLLAIQAADPKDVRLVFKHFPLSFHRHAMAAAQAAVEAQVQGKFWAFQALLWKHARTLTPTRLRADARAVGMDVQRLDTALKVGRHRWAVQADRAEGRKAGVRGTPTLFINGKRLVGARPRAVLAAEVAKAKSEALLLLKKPGVTRRNLYATILKKAVSPLTIPAVTKKVRNLLAWAPPPNRPTVGPSDGAMEVWFFGNPMCYDARRMLALSASLQAKFGRRIRIRFFHHFSAIKMSYQLVALLAEEANRQGLFWPFFAAVARKRPYRREELLAIAHALGLKSPETALESKSLRRAVIRDLKFTARLLKGRMRHSRSCNAVWLPPGQIFGVWSGSSLAAAIRKRLEHLNHMGLLAPPP